MRHVPDDVAVARERAFFLDEKWTRRFDEARAVIGRMPCNGAGDSVIESTAWGRKSWMRLAERVGSALSEDDWIKRVDRAPGKSCVPIRRQPIAPLMTTRLSPPVSDSCGFRRCATAMPASRTSMTSSCSSCDASASVSIREWSSVGISCANAIAPDCGTGRADNRW